MKALPFRLKIALLSTLTSGLVLAGFGAAAWLLIYQQRLDGVDREIRSLSARHPGWFMNRPSSERLTSALEFTFGEERKEHVILQITDSSGVPGYRSPHWPADLDTAALGLTAPRKPGITRSGEESLRPPDAGGGPPWAGGGGPGPGGMGKGSPGRGRGPGALAFTTTPRFLTVETKASAWRLGVFGVDDTTLVLGVNFAEVQGELGHLRNGFLIALPIALALIGLGGWLVGGRALGPLKTIAETAETVTSRGLDQRIPTSHEDPEIDRVILVLNRMMDRLETSFRQAIRFSADASHELKTPLTIMHGELENALQAASPGSREQQVFSNLLEETHRLKSIVQSLLLLARADAGQLKLDLEELDLAAMLKDLLEDVRLLAAEQHLILEINLGTAAMVRADRSLLQASLFNLLSNAVKHNEPRGRIRVQLEARDHWVFLEVGNAGPGIPAQTRAKLFERFHRGDAARNRRLDGVGLGLSLAREIVRAHQGDLKLKESRPGWTAFELQLPERSEITSP